MKLIRSPQVLLHRRPVSFLTVSVLGSWHIWYGVWLAIMSKTSARNISFRGPLTFFGYHTWSWLFIGAGAIMLVTLVTPETKRRLELIVPALVPLAWAGGWWAGPLSTAQPTYTLLAALVVGQPWIHRIAARYIEMIPHE